MKYLNASFSSPANSRAYVEGWERVFGDELSATPPGDAASHTQVPATVDESGKTNPNENQ